MLVPWGATAFNSRKLRISSSRLLRMVIWCQAFPWNPSNHGSMRLEAGLHDIATGEGQPIPGNDHLFYFMGVTWSNQFINRAAWSRVDMFEPGSFRDSYARMATLVLADFQRNPYPLLLVFIGQTLKSFKSHFSESRHGKTLNLAEYLRRWAHLHLHRLCLLVVRGHVSYTAWYNPPEDQCSTVSLIIIGIGPPMIWRCFFLGTVQR